ncbi:MAG: methyl-accepting chemotaxis protein [Defluviitaleaceae bacterium]|nr:methyl-accepting chemotaxis protein [Defluviitaleaceae bacterium]
MFRNMKIGMRVSLGFAVVTAIAVVIVLFSLRTIRTVNDEYANIITGASERVQIILQIPTEVTNIRRIATTIAWRAGDVQAVSGLRTELDVVNSNIEVLLDEFRANILADTLLDDIARNSYLRSADELWGLVMYYETNISVPVVAAALLGDEETVLTFAAAGGPVVAGMTEIYTYIISRSQQLVSDTYNDLNSTTSTTWFVILIISVIGVIVVATIAVLIIRSITKPLKKVVQALYDVSKGKVNVNIDTRNVNKDEVGQLYDSLLEITKSLGMLTKDFDEMDVAVRSGLTHYRIVDANLEGAFGNIVSKANSLIHDYEYMLDLISEPFALIDSKMRVRHINKATRKLMGLEDASWDRIVGMHVNDCMHGDIAGNPATLKAFADGSPQLEFDIQLEVGGQMLDFEYNCLPFKYDDGLSGAVILMTNLSHIRSAQRRNERVNAYQGERTKIFKSTLISALESGNLDINFPKSTYDEDTKGIAQDYDSVEEVVHNSIGTIKSYVDEITAKLGEIADNNFDVSIDREYMGDFSSIKDSIGMIVESVGSLVSEIQSATYNVEVGAGEIAQSAQVLMASFEEQASSMTEVRDAVDVLTEKTQKNANDLKSAGGLTLEVQNAAEDGAKRMEEMSKTMEEIKMSSAEIAKVASLIEDIAFQTNLLALNASVEAARAGEHGKGFAVVAEEVRSLASRSSDAAKNAAEIIAKSIERVDGGVSKSAQTKEALDGIVKMMTNATTVMSGIAQVSGEQAEEISRIQKNIDAIYSASTENAEAVQSKASVSEELSGQANMLMALVDRFRIGKK